MKNILVVVELAEGCAKVLDQSVELARACSSKLWLVHVTPEESPKWGPDYIGNEPDSSLPRRQEAEELHEAHKRLQKKAQSLRTEGLDATALLIEGSLQEKVLSEADRVDADMIVVGSHCHGSMFDKLGGHLSDWVAQQSKRPVLMVPTGQA